MDYLDKARKSLETVMRRVAEGTASGDDVVAGLMVVQADTAIAHAEASRPRWVQLGTHVINLAQVAYINLQSKDFDGKRRVEVAFASTTDGGHMALTFSDDYEETVIKLSDALYGCMAGPDPATSDPYRGDRGDASP